MRPILDRSSALSQWTRSFSHTLSRAFPTPSLLLPTAAGIDISDSSIKWLAFSTKGDQKRVVRYGEVPLESGIVVSGMVQDVPRLGQALKRVRKALGGIAAAHAALPEELAYVFGMHLPDDTGSDQAIKMIEFEFEDRVPIPPSAAVYDYNPLSENGVGLDEAAVVVFPKEVAEAYADAFALSGITLLSLEVEARSIARAVSGAGDPITLLVDFGKARTGFAVLKEGQPIFTSTVQVGGDMMTQALVQKLGISEEKAEEFKNEHGLFSAGADKGGVEAVSGTASALADEVMRHFHYWDTRRNDEGQRVTPVGKILFVGGSANLRGLTDYIAGRAQAPCERGNVWRNVASFDDYIPPIDKRHSLQYATAIGLALRGL
ncbi:MAG TPA: pilus assembly protein PilM [Candidatus Paceibacterota bacterium]|nr:pilus assembly protein PilM [Candidatus Paceibacterota bacterium]